MTDFNAEKSHLLNLVIPRVIEDLPMCDLTQKKILQNIFNRGIRNLTDQNSLINPDPMVYLKTL